jgi:hypothetical protein
MSGLSATTTFEAIAREWHALNIIRWTEGHGQDVLHRLEALEKILGIDMRDYVADLRAHADGLEERESDGESPDPEQNRHFPDVAEEFDIDELFSGLLDR